MFFNFLTSDIFWFATSFFAVPQVAGPGGGFLSFWTRFRTDFSSFCDSRNTGFYSVFLFSACLTASFKNFQKPRKLRYFMLRCEWKHRKYQCFLTLVTLKNHGICSGFCFSPRKNTVNNSNFAVFFMFFVIFWTALVRYTWLSNSSRFFFPTISTFGCFWSQWPTSLAVTSGCPTMRCGRLPSRSDVNNRRRPPVGKQMEAQMGDKENLLSQDREARTQVRDEYWYEQPKKTQELGIPLIMEKKIAPNIKRFYAKADRHLAYQLRAWSPAMVN